MAALMTNPFNGVRHIPAIGFGPSGGNLAHVVDKYIELDQLVKAYKGYKAILTEIFNRHAE